MIIVVLAENGGEGDCSCSWMSHRRRRRWWWWLVVVGTLFRWIAAETKWYVWESICTSRVNAKQIRRTIRVTGSDTVWRKSVAGVFSVQIDCRSIDWSFDRSPFFFSKRRVVWKTMKAQVETEEKGGQHLKWCDWKGRTRRRMKFAWKSGLSRDWKTKGSRCASVQEASKKKQIRD